MAIGAAGLQGDGNAVPGHDARVLNKLSDNARVAQPCSLSV
jgi:hypothetical protein